MAMRFVMSTWVRVGGDEDWAALSDVDRSAVLSAHEAWFAEHGAAGHIVGGEELGPAAASRTIRRRRSGEPLITDGPFVETKETLGGFILLEAASMDEALAIAATWPGFPDWSAAVEVRPTDATSAS
jgi:hypothetical protein